jgi:hypothetical protein
MRNRATKLLWAILGVGFAGLTLPAVADTLQEQDKALQEPDKGCVAAPDGPATPGSRWYYRVDRETKRHCWYLRNDAQGVAQFATASADPAAAAPPLNTPVPVRRSVADAGAEIAPVAEAVEPTNANGAAPAMAPNITNNDSAGGGQEPLDAGSRTPTETSSDQSGAELPAGATPSYLPGSVRKQIGHHTGRPLWMLLIALAGALALAGIASGAIARLSRSRAIRPHGKRGRERAIWSAAAAPDQSWAEEDISEDSSWNDDSLDEAPNETPMDWIRIARETQIAREIQEASRRSEQIEQLLASVKRRSAV